MNIDNEVFINAFQKEMIKSNNNSEWWKNHLSEQINNLFGNSLEQSTKDAILSSAKAFIESGTLTKTQYFYQTKEISDKKEIFASAKLNEKNHIFNIITPEDKKSLINNNEHIKLNDLYKILTAQEIEYENKKEITNLLDNEKIINLKKNYPDLEKMLKEWLGKKYEEIFPKEENQQQNQQQTQQPQQQVQQTPIKNIQQNELLNNYRNAQNKIEFFNSITDMNEKQKLFSQLQKTEKQEILNNENTSFLSYFYNNAKNKNELLSLMNTKTIQNIYHLSSNEDKQIISNYLHSTEKNLNNTINKNVNNISTENTKIANYNQNIINSKNNISNLKNEKQVIKLNIKNSKVVIKSLNKRKNKLEKKLTNTILKSESRISFINKRRLEKITKLTNELNLANVSIENTERKITTLNKELNKTNQQIEKEKNSIQENKQNISTSYQNLKNNAFQIRNTKVEIKQLSSFHKQLIGKKAYNHSKNNAIMTISKVKVVKLENTPRIKENITKQNNVQPSPQNNISQPQNTISNQTNKNIQNNNKIISFADQKQKLQSTNKPPITSQNLKKVEKELNDKGITYNYDNYINKQQDINFLPEKLTQLSEIEIQIMQLHYEKLYYQKMAEMMKLLQQQLAMNGKSRTLSKGFSNIIIFVLSLTIVTLISILTFLILK